MNAELLGPVVRVARPSDVRDAGELTAAAFGADGSAQDEAYAAELRDAERRAREAVLLVAAVPTGDGREAVVGTLTVAPYGSSYAEVAEPDEVELRMLAVAPEARRRGVAAALVHAALREAVAGGARRVVLSTTDALVAAQQLYRRLGFVAAPERDWSHEGVHLGVHVWTAPAPPGELVEAATWPPVRVVDVDGWRLGLSGGVTRRANSVLPLVAPTDVEAALDEVEARYAAEGLPAVIRVGPAARPADLDRRLDARGYARGGVTDVLVRRLDEGVPRPGGMGDAPGAASWPPGVWPSDRQHEPRPLLHLVVSEEPDERWVRAWLAGKAASAAEATGAAVLTGCPARYLTAASGDRVTGIVRVAFAGDWAALSCLAVAPTARGRGLGRALTLAALELARRHGARRAFLPVEADNAVAARLYAGLGFTPAQRYAYRELTPR